MDSGSHAFAFHFMLTVFGVAIAFVLTFARSRASRIRVAAFLSIWLAVTAGLAAAGALHFQPPPATIMLLIGASFALTIFFALSGFGDAVLLNTPLAAIVGFQVFRVAVEMLLHRAHQEGLVPVQMTYSGWNFDIISGISAPLVAILLARSLVSVKVAWAWNFICFALLLNIISIAIRATPMLGGFPGQPLNVWI